MSSNTLMTACPNWLKCAMVKGLIRDAEQHGAGAAAGFRALTSALIPEKRLASLYRWGHAPSQKCARYPSGASIQSPHPRSANDIQSEKRQHLLSPSPTSQSLGPSRDRRWRAALSLSRTKTVSAGGFRLLASTFEELTFRRNSNTFRRLWFEESVVISSPWIDDGSEIHCLAASRTSNSSHWPDVSREIVRLWRSRLWNRLPFRCLRVLEVPLLSEAVLLLLL